MKKVALSLLALAVVAVGAFADAPKWDPKVSTGLTGNASVTLGTDLDTGDIAFANGTSVSLFIDLVSGGEAKTASDADVWGEIRVYTDGDPIRLKSDGVASGTAFPGSTALTTDAFSLKVDYAKIHFGKDAYLSVSGHETKMTYAEYPDLAFWAAKRSGLYGSTATPLFSAALADRGPGTAGGFEFGFAIPSLLGITLDAGSVDAWKSAGPNGNKSNFVGKGEVSLLAVPNLTLAAGADYSSADKADMAFGANVAYKLALSETAYLKPYFKLDVVQLAGAGDFLPQYIAGVIYGLGAKAATFDNWGLKFDKDWGGYPGVSFAMSSTDKKIGATTKDVLWLNVSANSGPIIADTSVVAAYEIVDLNAANGTDSVLTVGASTSMKSGDVTIAPKALINYENNASLVAAASYIYVKATADISGVIPFVVFTVNYESNDFSDKANTVAGNKLGKFEFTTKVTF